LHPAARRDRGDVGARSASVPAAGHAVPVDVRHAGVPQPACLRAHRVGGDRIMTETASAPTQTESVEEFAARTRAWLAEHMPRIDPDNRPEADRGEEAPWLRARELQKMLWNGGFAGICFPREYGGLGLPIAYQKAF